MSVSLNLRSDLRDLPLKVQAQRIKNNGNSNIYICEMEDDVALDRTSMLAFSRAIILPGQELDITTNPYISGCFSFPDCDVTIHSETDVCVNVVSHADCERWMGSSNHPWNGYSTHNNGLTRKFSKRVSGIDFIPIHITIEPEKKCVCGKTKAKDLGKHSYWCEIKD